MGELAYGGEIFDEQLVQCWLYITTEPKFVRSNSFGANARLAISIGYARAVKYKINSPEKRPIFSAFRIDPADKRQNRGEKKKQ